MEEERFDPYKFTGVILIAMILTWMLFRNENASNNYSQTNDSKTLQESKLNNEIFAQAS